MTRYEGIVAPNDALRDADEWAVAHMFPELIPVSVGGEVMAAIAEGLEAAGFDAYFKDATGFRTLWVRRSAKA
jgi:hypothetical protein